MLYRILKLKNRLIITILFCSFFLNKNLFKNLYSRKLCYKNLSRLTPENVGSYSRVFTVCFNCADREMPKWQGKRKLFGVIANLVKSANGFVVSDHEHEESELITLGDRSFQVAAPALWNVLPREIRSITDLGIFKCHLKTHLFREAFY